MTDDTVHAKITSTYYFRSFCKDLIFFHSLILWCISDLMHGRELFTNDDQQ